MDNNHKIDQIRKFWNNRAKQYGELCTATLGEVALRRLEIKTMAKYIKRYNPASVLDVGCGNGYSTQQYAKEFQHIEFYGVDYSPKMIEFAPKNSLMNCCFDVADVVHKSTLPKKKFSLIITQRCIQNLPDYDSQYTAINNLLSLTTTSGRLLLMECSKDGVAQLNKYRRKFGRKAIDGIEPWHNNFFIDERIISDFGCHIDYFTSTYMFLTRIVHPRLSRVGYLLPSIGKFGYDRLYIIQ